MAWSEVIGRAKDIAGFLTDEDTDRATDEPLRGSVRHLWGHGAARVRPTDQGPSERAGDPSPARVDRVARVRSMGRRVRKGRTVSPWAALRRRIDHYATTAEKLSGAERGAARVDGLRELRETIDAEIDREVIAARDQGATWERIGPTKQAGMQRYNAAMTRKAKRDGEH